MADLSDYSALFGEDFADVAEAFSGGIPDDLENLLVGVIDDIAFAAAGFNVAVNSAVNTMVSTGMSVQYIETTLRGELAAGTGPFAALKNNIKKAVTRGINQSSRLGQYKTYFSDQELQDLGKKALWAWVNVSGHRICVDCAARAGEIKTFPEWEREGLPGSGSTVCTAFCYCVLDPIGKLGSTVEIKGKKIKYHKLSATDAAAVVNREIAKAKAAEKSITDALRRINKEMGTDFHGLKFALKDRESAIRKFLKENVENGWSVQDVLKKNLADMNRYTLIINEATYADDVLAIFSNMEAQGFKKMKIKNYWGDRLYKGCNTNWYDPVTGRKIEIQFNTLKSQTVKDKWSHKLYETYRDVTATQAARDAAERQLMYRWGNFADEGGLPNGWQRIQNYP